MSNHTSPLQPHLSNQVIKSLLQPLFKQIPSQPLSSTNQQADMPAHAIFEIYEILEKILLYTDMRTVIASCQRVNRYWHALICSSSPLQEALFFKPCKELALPGVLKIRNPLIDEFIWKQYFIRRPRAWQGPRPRYRDLYDNAIITHKNRDKNQKKEKRQLQLQLPARLTRKQEKAWQRHEASWKRMLIHQPPSREMGLLETFHPDWLLYASCRFSRLGFLQISNTSGNFQSNDERSQTRGYLRLGHLAAGCADGTLRAGSLPLVFWNAESRERPSHKLEVERWITEAEYAMGCEVVVFCRQSVQIPKPTVPADGDESDANRNGNGLNDRLPGLQAWFQELGCPRKIRGKNRVAMWKLLEK
ncbi:F-box protein [Aspergillus saccharolyticus JOP 1030-1]|uniref:F-box domain-containing protein n=1 Tax=Aspergillus saccharolyticus JOP 1030-1 TaxID=1450539 RepID=A0A319AS81_9EURO|nr:hypothetical protein BP01DRAFT_388228 [Aspergillus saccharolyticus JOP 1030-1]PYH49142.1 hypothetical protein BP01DRAFT_388228 [Aspergillus saccharolyticus JOP 1030-1]